MIKRFALASALALVATMGLGNSADAAFMMGTQGIADNGTPTINTNDITTATMFTFGSLVTTTAETGDFAGNSGLPLTATTLSLGTTFTAGSAAFGTFTSTSATETIGVNSVTFNVLGNFTPGTRFGGGAATPASWTVIFAQAVPGGAIADSASLSIPPTGVVVPEPASIAMLGLGLVGVGGFAARRRNRATK